MLKLFKSKLERNNNHAFEDGQSTDHTATVDEESLKRAIAAKLQDYKPLEKEANFVGPSL